MQEVACLVDSLLINETLEWHFWTYRHAFEEVLCIDPLTASNDVIRSTALAHVDIQMDPLRLATLG